MPDQRIREAGFTKELGFQVSDLAIYIDSIHAMFERERTLLLSRMRGMALMTLTTLTGLKS